MEKNLKISIITVCLNDQNNIEKTIQSIVNQSYPNIEYIIIDGSSSDSTQQIIKKYLENITFFISEPDNGIYDAMNKGLKKSDGDIIYFLNSGDVLYAKTTIEMIVKKFLDTIDTDIIYGDYFSYNYERTLKISSPTTNELNILSRGICHQTIFAKKTVFDKTGMFDIRYKMFADCDWLFKASLKKCKFLQVPRIICYYLEGGFSRNSSTTFFKEKLSLMKRNILNMGIKNILKSNPEDIIYFFGVFAYLIVNNISIRFFNKIFLINLKNFKKISIIHGKEKPR